MLKVIIFGKTLEQAKSKLYDLVNKEIHSPHEEVPVCKYEACVQIKDIEYKALALCCCDSVRGSKIDMAIMPCDIDGGVDLYMVRPLLSSSRLPEDARRFYY